MDHGRILSLVFGTVAKTYRTQTVIMVTGRFADTARAMQYMHCDRSEERKKASNDDS